MRHDFRSVLYTSKQGKPTAFFAFKVHDTFFNNGFPVLT